MSEHRTRSRSAFRDPRLVPGLLCLLLIVLPMSLPAVAAEPTAAPQLDAARAYEYLVRICRLGSRMSGSPGMQAQQKLLAEHFASFGAQVRFQAFDIPHPETGAPVRMQNMIVSWHPQAKERVLLCCHYDTRPWPDRDPFRPRGTFIGANDGGSGVALFMELAHHMPTLEPTFGVDFVLFDGEEFIFGNEDWLRGAKGEYFLGSKHFAQQYRDNPPGHRYIWGVLVDMIADRRLELYMEKNSLKFAPQLVESIWDTAARMGVREFIPRAKHRVEDDHIPLNEIAGIPSIDIIDMDYPHWHTTRDVPAQCSGESLVKAGRVLLQWLTEVPRPQPR